jgi:alpha-tubulin suppressor-like RCC1 family protein
VAIATGSRHSLAIRADGSLWAWGEGFAIEPAQVMARVRAVAAGDTATIVMTEDGALGNGTAAASRGAWCSVEGVRTPQDRWSCGTLRDARQRRLSTMV